jgi:hypothetical protein
MANFQGLYILKLTVFAKTFPVESMAWINIWKSVVSDKLGENMVSITWNLKEG